MGRLRHLLLAATVCCLLVTPVAAAGFGPPSQFGGTGIEPDGVFLRVSLAPDGSAQWAIDYRVRLDDENTTEAFESLRADIEANQSAYTETFASRMETTAAAAENSTGREMSIRNVSVTAERRQLPQEYGVLTYEFEWTGFAAVDGDELRAGDALAGLFLDRQTTLVVSWPAEYTATSVDPTPDERRDDAVVWIGPTEFGSGQPSVSLSSAATTTAAGGDDGTGGTGDSDGGGGLPLAALVVVALVVAAVAVVLWRRRERATPSAATADADDSGATDRPEAGATAASGDTDDADAEAPPVTDDEAGGDADPDDGVDEREAGSAVDADAGDADEAPWDDELLSNEERVVVLLEHEGGRMKQQAIASELDWSDAKTSQVIGKMRDAEQVETFRLGRENVVSLPEETET